MTQTPQKLDSQKQSNKGFKIMWKSYMLLERWHCGAAGSSKVKDSKAKGQRKFGGL